MIQKQIQQSNECQGIIGYLGNDPKAEEVCFNGLQSLSVPGYDSCGIVTIDPCLNEMIIHKQSEEKRFGAMPIDLLIKQCRGQHIGNIGLAHTRWATHGQKTHENAHPHLDQSKKIALVHNGFIENYQQLIEQNIIDSTCKLQSETDTEVIAQIIGQKFDSGESLVQSVYGACSLIIGSYNMAMICKEDPNSIYAFKNTGQMGIAISKDNQQCIISSDLNILNEEFKDCDIRILPDKQIVQIKRDEQGINVSYFQFPKSINGPTIHLKPGIEHYFVQEMLEQPEAVQKCLNYGNRLDPNEYGMARLGGLESNEEKLLEIKNLVIAACGTSYYASLYGQRLMREFQCFDTIEVKIASEIDINDLRIEQGGLLSVSQSGETTDLLQPFQMAGKLGLFRFNIVNNVESTLAREAKCGLFLNAGKEQSVASTKAFICQVVAFSLITMWFSQKVNYKQTKDLRQNIYGELQTLSEKVKEVVNDCNQFSQTVAKMIKNENHIFLLGEGYAECVAKEGSLKMKELTYKHCQAYSLNNCHKGFYNYAKNHQGTCVFYVILDDEFKELSLKYLKSINQSIKARIIILSDISIQEEREALQNLSEIQYWVPHSGYLSALLCIIPIQLLAFQTALDQGRNPDQPRSLTKVVL
ncbi:glucosamine--fructose-6-phosphate aminotransferase [Stylonychia lemnae]|uniref:glutamine--fructose-6-phosphate transaminase (isomerizing) n=1 Tax=Stylonychia lemnae TaxID=5949 RepID=A0A077ZWS7_STYLE|nr:glucosamine--fructose-6-phosphate aminotransferase [Stylonychia lemnae]|eukprot:CDW73742.1 glucosamine--fructose-6-phosphate aminotransferase [Stylonychia lemnae]